AAAKRGNAGEARRAATITKTFGSTRTIPTSFCSAAIRAPLLPLMEAKAGVRGITSRLHNFTMSARTTPFPTDCIAANKRADRSESPVVAMMAQSPFVIGTRSRPRSIGKYRADPTAAVKQRGVIYTVAPSPLEVNRIWCGTDDGLIHLTTNGGKTWNDVTSPAISAWQKISIIEAGHFDANTAYAA